jgi:hypothetical protein
MTVCWRDYADWSTPACGTGPPTVWWHFSAAETVEIELRFMTVQVTALADTRPTCGSSRKGDAGIVDAHRAR